MTKVVQQLKHIETDENQFFPIWITLKWIFQLVIKCSFTCTWNGSRVRKCSHKNRAMTTFPAALILISIFVSYVNTTKSIGTVTRHWALLSAQAPVRISSATAAALVPVCNVEWVKSKVNIYTVLPQNSTLASNINPCAIKVNREKFLCLSCIAFSLVWVEEKKIFSVIFLLAYIRCSKKCAEIWVWKS